MDEKSNEPAGTVAPLTIDSVVDVYGNVVVWDHGPPESDKTHKAWHAKNGDGPAPIVMEVANAAHAIAVDPKRYALEPVGLDDGAVAAKVQEIVDRRLASEKAAADHAAAVQLAADRRQAVNAVMAERAAAAAAEPIAPEEAPAEAEEAPTEVEEEPPSEDELGGGYHRSGRRRR